MTNHLQTHTSTQHRMATPICNADSLKQPFTAIAITAQRQAAHKHAQQQHAIKNRDKLCSEKQHKLNKYFKKVYNEYKAVSDSEDSG